MLNGTTSSRHSSWCAAPMTIVVAYAAMIAAPSTDDGDRASARCARPAPCGTSGGRLGGASERLDRGAPTGWPNDARASAGCPLRARPWRRLFPIGRLHTTAARIFVATRANAVVAFTNVSRRLAPARERVVTRSSGRGRPPSTAVADAVGRCVLVFVFVPTLVALPGWLRYEASNPLNFSDVMVTLFIPIRGLRALLNAFQAGMDAGLLSGLMDGLLVYAWFSSRGDVATRRQRMLVGASLGAAAGVVAVVVVLAIQAFRGGQPVIPLVPIAFEIGSGAVCGIIAIPAAARLLVPRD